MAFSRCTALQCFAVCCSMRCSDIQPLQCVAVCCRVLQGGYSVIQPLQCVALCVVAVCVAVVFSRYSVLQSVSSCVAVTFSRCSMLQSVAVCCSVLQCAVVCCSVLRYTPVCCSVLQCVLQWHLAASAAESVDLEFVVCARKHTHTCKLTHALSRQTQRLCCIRIMSHKSMSHGSNE